MIENPQIKAYVFLITLVGFIWLLFKGNQSDKEKEKRCSIETIAYTNSIEKYSSGPDLKFYFYVNGRKVTGEITEAYSSLSHKFYKIRYNPNNVTENIIGNELNPDSLAFIKAGFKIKKVYYYDDITATYKEKWEWK